ncbi:MAG: hypothetical protein WBA16_04750 [Nonlabens sp.]
MKHKEESRVLKVVLTKNKSQYTNTFTYINTSLDHTIFSLSYTLNNATTGWKWNEQENAIIFSNQLKSTGINLQELYKLDFILNDGFFSMNNYVYENQKDKTLFSTLAYLKSATSSNIRHIETSSEEIHGTVNPFFLSGDSYFSFQEDAIVKLKTFHDNHDLFEIKHGEIASQADIDLMNYVNSTNDEVVSFDEIYKFLLP